MTSNVLQGYFKQAHSLDRKAYVSRSKIATANEGLEYLFAEYGEGIQRPVTPIMLEGRKLHMATLEPEEYRRRYPTHRFNDTSTPEAKAWEARMKRENQGIQLISPMERLRVDRIVDRIMSHKLAGPLLSTATNERHGYAYCPRTGALLYSRPDILTSHGEIAELKFVKSVDPFAFNRQQYSEKWFMQLAFYNAVHGLITGERRVGNCFFIAVEHFYPHRIAVLTLTPTYEQMGDILWNEGLDKILFCMGQDPQMKNYEVWRHESNKARELEPEYFMMNNDERFKPLMGIGA